MNQLKELEAKRGVYRVRSGYIGLDGTFNPDELREIANALENIDREFYLWYAKVKELDKELEEEPVNVYWYDYANGITPEESYANNGQVYGRKK